MREIEAKYVALKSAWRESARIWAREKKEADKDRQRIIQLAYELIAVGTWDPGIARRAEKILGILKVSGYS